MEEEMKDVYITEHVPVEPKYWTTNKKETEQYFKYYQSLQEYKNQPTNFSKEQSSSRFAPGSAL